MADDTNPAGPPPGPGAGETQPAAEGPTQVSPPPTEPTPPTPTTPAPTTPGGPPPGGPAAPKAGGGSGGVATPLFVVVAIVAVAAIAFAIFSFLGKNSEADDKKEAQKEAAAANDRADAAEEEVAALEEENASLNEQLGISEDAGELLGQIVTEGAAAADVLKVCSDTAREFAVNEINGTSTIEQAQAVDDQCAASDQAYNDFVDLINELASATE